MIVSATGLYQLGGEGRVLCEDCVKETLEANPRMRLSDWVEAQITWSDAEHCDACDCTPNGGK